MLSLRRLLVAALLIALPRPSMAECLTVVCEGETTELRITINRQDPGPEAGTELVVVGAPLGSCEPPVLLTPEAIPFVNPAPFIGFETYLVTIPTPFDGAPAHYQLLRRYPDGTTSMGPTCGAGLPWDTEGCDEEWLVGRARVTGFLFPPEVPSSRFDYTFCTDGCWVELPLVIATDALVDELTVGSFVTLHGTVIEDGMPGASHIAVSRIAEIDDPGTCGVVSSSIRTWGALKGRFD